MQNELAGRRTLVEAAVWQTRGSIDEMGVKSLLLSLCEVLEPLHCEGRVFGFLSPRHLVVDERDRLSLDPDACGSTNGGEQLFGVLADGYAAFEQYMDEADWPVGPWTDIYGLSALAYELVVGTAPPNAVARMVERSGITFESHMEGRFTASFLSAIARGLSLERRERQQSLDVFALDMGKAGVDGKKHRTSAGQTEKFGLFRWQALVALTIAVVVGIWSWQGVGGQDTGILQAVDNQPGPSLAAMADSANNLGDSPPGSMASVAVSEESTPVLMDEEAFIDRSVVSAPIEPAEMDLPRVDEMPARTPVEQMSAPPAIDSLPEKPAKRQAEPRTGAVHVRVDVRPWGEVFVNGAFRGVSPPLRSLNLSPGVYQIRIVNGDLPAGSFQLTVKAGEPARIAHKFSEEK